MPTQISLLPPACVDQKQSNLHTFLNKAYVNPTDFLSTAMDVDTINSMEVFFDPKIAFIDPTDKIAPPQGVFGIMQGSSLDKKPHAEILITRHLPMNSGNGNDISHLFALSIDQILHHRNGAPNLPAKSKAIFIPFSTNVHGMNLLLEFYGTNQVRVTITNSYNNGDTAYGRSQEAYDKIKSFLERRNPKITVDPKINFVQLVNQKVPGPCGLYSCFDAQILAKYMTRNDHLDFKDGNGLLDFVKIKADMLKNSSTYQQHGSKIYFRDDHTRVKELLQGWQEKTGDILNLLDNNDPAAVQEYFHKVGHNTPPQPNAPETNELIKSLSAAKKRHLAFSPSKIKLDNMPQALKEKPQASETSPETPAKPTKSAVPKDHEGMDDSDDNTEVKTTRIDVDAARTKLLAIQKQLANNPDSKYRLIDISPAMPDRLKHQSLLIYEIQCRDEKDKDKFTTKATITIDPNKQFAKQELSAASSTDDLRESAKIFVQTVLATHQEDPVPLTFFNGDETKTLEYAHAIKEFLDKIKPPKKVAIGCDNNQELANKIKHDIFKIITPPAPKI
jgi:hypothetical protein